MQGSRTDAVKIPDHLVLRFSLVFGLVACEKPSVEWTGSGQQLAMPAPGDESAAPADAQLVLRSDGSPALAAIAPAATMPADRALSFVEVALFCVVRHLPFREIMDVSKWSRLAAFCNRFGERPGAKATEYRFDSA